MKTIYKIALLALVIPLLTLSCKKEGKITPSTDPEPTPGAYDLPQGDHDYDDDIVAFYEDYNSVILYKFDHSRFSWNVQQDLTWDTEPGTGTAGQRLHYEYADEDYIGVQLEMFKSKFTNFYPAELLQVTFPQSILLVGELYRLPQGFEGEPTDDDKQFLNAYFASFHMIVGRGNSEIANFDPAAINSFAYDLHSGYLAWMLNRGAIEVDIRFVAAYNSVTSKRGYANGFLSTVNVATYTADWNMYVNQILSNTEAEFAAKYLASNIDTSGRIKRKYEYVLDYFKSLGIDLNAIANDRE